MTPTYHITTIEPGTGRYTPQVGVPEYVVGWGGLRRAIRKLRKLGYEARRNSYGHYAVRVRRVKR